MDDFTRHDPPASGPERDMLIAFLEYQRATLLMKVSGLSDADLRRSQPGLDIALGALQDAVEFGFCRIQPLRAEQRSPKIAAQH